MFPYNNSVYDFINKRINYNELLHFGDNYKSYSNKLVHFDKVIMEYKNNNLLVYKDNYKFNTPKKLLNYIYNTISPENYFVINRKLLHDNDIYLSYIDVLDYDYKINYVKSTFSQFNLKYNKFFYNTLNIGYYKSNKCYTLIPVKPLLFKSNINNKVYITVRENKYSLLLDVSSEYNNYMNVYKEIDHNFIDELFHNNHDRNYFRVGNLKVETKSINNLDTFVKLKTKHINVNNNKYMSYDRCVIYNYHVDKYNNNNLYCKSFTYNNIAYKAPNCCYFKLNLYWS